MAVNFELLARALDELAGSEKTRFINYFRGGRAKLLLKYKK
jgi:hypothetical protein